MKNYKHWPAGRIWVLWLILSACAEEKKTTITVEEVSTYELELNNEELNDKVLGMIVGSAIGDAMGAPTEMWSREAIDLEYGWVSGLDSMVRETSPEGVWIPNLPAGGTTDDTRWKKLTYEYLTGEGERRLDPTQFARHVLNEYENYFKAFANLNPEDIQGLEVSNLRVFWLSEWSKVCRPIIENDLMGYQSALGKFYGGEMVCAGLLYSPAIGVYFPGQPRKAYQEAFQLSMFDLGYAKDISALAAAMTAAAMKKAARPEEILDVLRSVDPEGYFQSRLVGRSSFRILQKALSIVNQAKGNFGDSLHLEELPDADPVYDKTQMQMAFELLDGELQDMPFHAGEIHLQVLTAMIFSGFEFKETLVFLVNYGRDNDTTAAVAGAILGAYLGFEKLPAEMKAQVLEINKNILGIDMVKLSENLALKIYENHK